MADLVEWLTAQLDADEALARAVEPSRNWVGAYSEASPPHGPFIAANNPSHVLRTIAAHRAILDRHDHRGKWCLGAAPQPITGACPDVRALASIYEDRPGFDPSWRASPPSWTASPH